MSVIARFEVIPVREGSMSTAIAEALRALDRHPVSYQTTATDTIVEADTVDQVFAAISDAHQAIPEDRVITSVEVDEDRRRHQTIGERVASVERELGHSPERIKQPGAPPVQAAPQQATPQQAAPPQTARGRLPAEQPPVPQPSPQQVSPGPVPQRSRTQHPAPGAPQR